MDEKFKLYILFYWNNKIYKYNYDIKIEILNMIQYNAHYLDIFLYFGYQIL